MKPIRKSLVAAALAATVTLGLSDAHAQAAAAPAATKSAVKQSTFASTEAAASALADAIRAKDPQKLLAIVGPGSGDWLFSGDPVEDANDWKRFLAAYDEKHSFEDKGARAVLQVGRDDWPFPAPLVKKDNRWTFDANAGREEILNRRIGQNELDTMQTLLAIVDAQREYAASDADGNGFADYARRFVSTPGKKDGLYWASQKGQPDSPLGPLVAVAARDGYGRNLSQKQAQPQQPQAFHGYYYKIITAQGKNAAGGAYDYVVGDKLLGGFAVVAWPARYRVSGVTTFIVNHDGVIYEKDLGANGAAVAAAMSRYNPDPSWRKAQ